MENSIAGFQRQKDNRKPTVFHQLSKLISVGMLRNLAKKYEVDDKSRTSLPWSHVVSLLYCQLTHCIGLNDYVSVGAFVARLVALHRRASGLLAVYYLAVLSIHC